MPTVLLAYYCALVLVASIVGGMIPVWFQLTHRWMEFALSFVAGVMLGVGVLVLLPHAIVQVAALTAVSHLAIFGTMTALLLGMLVMFFIERFFSFHQHGVPNRAAESSPTVEHPHSGHGHALDPCHVHEHEPHLHDLTWGGAAVGMTLHSILDGVALAASVTHRHDGSWLAGFGTFLVILLHKPFDSMTIGTLMARGRWSMASRHMVNALFALAIPVGVVLFYIGLVRESEHATGSGQGLFVAYALAFSAGTFMCIALSDLLPELQFHQHDRGKLSAALLLGLAVAYAAGRLEAATHSDHPHAPMPVKATE